MNARARGWIEQQEFESKRLVKLAWEAAYFQRVPKFPRLSQVLGDMGKPAALPPEQEAAQVKALFTALGAGQKRKAATQGATDGAAGGAGEHQGR